MSNTRIWTIDPAKIDMNVINEAASVLSRGGTVAFPTETVYGLGANALDEMAVHKIFAAKGRPADNPLIIHVSSVEEVSELVTSISETALILMESFWPGPLTLILPKAGRVPDVTTGGLDSVAIRMPNHKIALQLIQVAGVPIAAPSANLSKRPSPTTAGHVYEDLNGRIDGLIDGGPTGVGLESTVVDVTSGYPVVLRPGGVTVEMLSTVSKRVEVDPNALGATVLSGQAKSPGMKYTHYAPKAEAVLVEGSSERIPGKVQALVNELRAQGFTVGVMGTTENLNTYSANVIRDMGPKSDANVIASRIFSVLRSFDATDVDRIVIEGIAADGLGLAIMNRLRKAAGHNIVYAR